MQLNSAENDTQPLIDHPLRKRVSARFTGVAIQTDGGNGKPRERERAPNPIRARPARSQQRDARDLRTLTLALFSQPGAALYSAQVARALSCSVSRAVYYLHQLESVGVLVSKKELSAISGNGRRIYHRCASQALPARDVDQQTKIAS